jgi:proton-translocating NADH-quinone oxidoreductase chain N
MLDFNIIFENHFKCLLPEVYLVTMTLFLLLVGTVISNSKQYKYPLLLEEMTLFVGVTLIFTSFLVVNNPLTNILIFNNLFIINDLSNIFKWLTLMATLCCLLITTGRIGINNFEYLILILCSTFGLLCLISSADLISMFLSLEVQSLSFYILASIHKNSAFSTEAGLKYYILGALSSGILLLGISFIYGIAGSTNFETLGKFFFGFDLSNLNQDVTNEVIAGIICIFVGVLFKLTAAPFHMWSPDVYEGSPFLVTIILSTVPKMGILIIAIQIFFFVLFAGFIYWQAIAVLCSVLSVSVGVLKALQQTKIKRFLAYSSIAHVGFLLLGFCTGSIIGLQSIWLYIVIYTVSMLNIWSIISAIKKINGGNRVRYINDLQGLSRLSPLLAYTFAINMFSMAGLPPLVGFFAKFYILFSSFESGVSILVIICILLFSVVSAFYYIRFIKIIFFDDNTVYVYKTSINYIHSLILGSTCLFIFTFFIYPDSLFIISLYSILENHQSHFLIREATECYWVKDFFRGFYFLL